MEDVQGGNRNVSANEKIVAANSDKLRKIGEVASEFGLTLRALRFYEDRGLIAPVRQGNGRFYRDKDISRLRLVLLGRRVGFSLRDIKQLLDLYEPDGSNFRQLKLALEKSERQLVRLRRQREELDLAIGEMQGLVARLESELEQAAPRRQAG